MKTKQSLIVAMMCFYSAIFSQIPNYVPLNGLQGFWPFTGNANDQTSNGYNGVVYGAGLTTDRFGNNNSAYSFDGISNYILTNYQGILGNSPRAVSFWAKNSQLTSPLYIVTWGSNQAGERFGVGFSSSPPGIGVGGAYCDVVYSTPAPISNNGWHHYVVQFSGTKLNDVSIYQDANLLSQVIINNASNTLLNTQPGFNVQFGRVDYSPQPQYYIGELDEFGIWNRTLTLCEIRQLYLSSLSNVNVTSSSSVICVGQSVTLSASGASTYIWSNGSTGPSITVSPAFTSTYMVNGTNSVGCSSAATLTVSITNCTAINKVAPGVQELLIYPNPSNGMFTCTGLENGSSVQVYDILGNILYQTQAGEKSFEVDLSKASKGIYFLKASYRGNSVIEKLVRD